MKTLLACTVTVLGCWGHFALADQGHSGTYHCIAKGEPERTATVELDEGTRALSLDTKYLSRSGVAEVLYLKKTAETTYFLPSGTSITFSQDLKYIKAYVNAFYECRPK